MGCAVCGEPVEQLAGRGRPRRYCSLACRRRRERQRRTLARLRGQVRGWVQLADRTGREFYRQRAAECDAAAGRLEEELDR